MTYIPAILPSLCWNISLEHVISVTNGA